jgi:predicted dehydrogenase
VPVLTPMVDIANARLAFEGGAVANITASRVSRERMRKLRLFQPNGYLSLDLAAGHGEFYRMKQGFDLAEVAKGPVALEAFVERIPLEGPDEQPLKLELISFLEAVRGEHEVVVTGEDGREALAIALRIVREIEKGLPNIARSSGRTRA